MKKLLISISCILLMVSCVKKKKKELVIEPIASTSTEIKEIKKEKKSNIIYNFKDFRYEVTYSLFTNSYHSNGFVIIKQVSIYEKDKLIQQYKLQNLIKNYIYDVDFPEKVEYIDINKNRISLINKKANEAIRTAEAVVIAYFEDYFGNNDIDVPTVEHVYEVSKRMIGRKVGIMSRKPLWKE